MKKIFLGMFVFVLLIVYGCTIGEEKKIQQNNEEHQQIKVEEQPVIPSFDPTSLTTEAMLEDYDYLWSILNENCLLLDGLSREKKLNLEEVRQKGRERIAVLQDGDLEGFEAGIGYLSGYFRGVGHLSPVSALTYSTVIEHNTYESETQKSIYHMPQVEAYYEWAMTLPKFLSQKRVKKKRAL